MGELAGCRRTPSRVKAAAVVVVFLAAEIAFAVAPAPSDAAFPGQNGRIVFAATQPGGDPRERDLYSMDSDGTGKLQLTRDPDTDDTLPSASADGTKIVFNRFGSSGFGDLYLINADGSGLRNLTDTPASSESAPVFSPDGTQLAFRRRSHPGSDSDIWTMNLDGTSFRNLSNDPAAIDSAPSWSPDGRSIAFTKLRDRSRTGSAVFVMRPDGTGVSQLTPWGTFGWPDWSPDGKSLIVLDEVFCDACGETDIFVVRSDGTKLHQLTDTSLNEGRAVWSPDGNRILFQAACFDFSDPACFYFDLFTMDRRGRSVANLTATADTGEGGAYWAPAASN